MPAAPITTHMIGKLHPHAIYPQAYYATCTYHMYEESMLLRRRGALLFLSHLPGGSITNNFQSFSATEQGYITVLRYEQYFAPRLNLFSGYNYSSRCVRVCVSVCERPTPRECVDSLACCIYIYLPSWYIYITVVVGNFCDSAIGLHTSCSSIYQVCMYVEAIDRVQERRSTRESILHPSIGGGSPR